MSNGSKVLIYLSFLLCLRNVQRVRLLIQWHVHTHCLSTALGSVYFGFSRYMKYICLLYNLIIICSRFPVNRHLEFQKKAFFTIFKITNSMYVATRPNSYQAHALRSPRSGIPSIPYTWTICNICFSPSSSQNFKTFQRVTSYVC